MDCANCGKERTGRFCGYCGQNDRDYQRALPPVVWDVLKEAFELDSRLLQTLKLILFRPGALSQEFSCNRRAGYVSPIRLYLFVSLAFFFILSINADLRGPAEFPEVQLEVERVEDDVDLDAFMAYLDAPRKAKVTEIAARTEAPFGKLMLYSLATEVSENPVPATDVEQFFFREAIDVIYEPRLFFERMLDNLPISMFFMLPVYAFLLAIFYVNKRRFYVEHLVFGVHLHTFAFAVFAVLLLLPEGENVFVDTVAAVLTLSLFLYYFAALKRYYGEGFLLTGVKWMLLLGTYSLLLIPGFLFTVFVTLNLS